MCAVTNMAIFCSSLMSCFPVIIIIIIIIIIIPVITFTQGIYSYIPETNYFSSVHNFAAVLYLQFILHVMSFSPRNVFYTFTLALSAVCVQCTILVFFSVP